MLTKRGIQDTQRNTFQPGLVQTNFNENLFLVIDKLDLLSEKKKKKETKGNNIYCTHPGAAREQPETTLEGC